MDKNFYNVASNFWGKNIGCVSCSKREKTTVIPNEMNIIKPKKEANQPSYDNLNTSSNINNSSQISDESNENPSSDLTSYSIPIKFSGNPKGKIWSKEEDEMLKEAVKMHNGKNWKLIATKVPGRGSTQCSQRWRRIQPYKNRFPWTSEEDCSLAELVHKYGQNWSIIASSLPGRTGKQVRERYLNNLDPNINRNRFTSEEDEKIIELYANFGPKWKEISKEFFGRTENMIKNRFYSHIKKKLLLKFPLRYKKALEKAQTDLSINNNSSPKEKMLKSEKKNNVFAERFSQKDDFSEFESTFKQKLSELEYQTMEFLNKESTDFNKLCLNISNKNIQNNGFPIQMELEENSNKIINDGFLNLYHNTKETPKKNEFNSIFSPLNMRLQDGPFESNLIKQEMEIENHDYNRKNNASTILDMNNFEKNECFLSLEDQLLCQKYEAELNESKNNLMNNFFNVKDFEVKEAFKNNFKIEGNQTNVQESEKSNQNINNPDEKLRNQVSYLNQKKTTLETLIKEIIGKIDQSNSQNL